MKTKKPKIEALGVQYPGTYRGLAAACKSLGDQGGVVHLGAGVNIRLPKAASESLGFRISKKP